MKLNNVITYEILSICLCNNICLKLLSILFLIISIHCCKKHRKKELELKNYKDVSTAIIIICLNQILNIDLTIINFLYFGILCMLIYLFLPSFKLDKINNFYLALIVVKGVIEFWLNL